MTVQDVLALAKVTKYGNLVWKDLAPRICCMDGTTLSVQASEYTYCTPRSNSGPYSQVEVGYPSRPFDQLLPYIDGDADSDPTATVYGYVPIEIVEEIVADCGGICAETTILAKEKHQ